MGMPSGAMPAASQAAQQFGQQSSPPQQGAMSGGKGVIPPPPQGGQQPAAQPSPEALSAAARAANIMGMSGKGGKSMPSPQALGQGLQQQAALQQATQSGKGGQQLPATGNTPVDVASLGALAQPAGQAPTDMGSAKGAARREYFTTPYSNQRIENPLVSFNGPG